MAWNLDFWFRFGGLQSGSGGDINTFLGNLNSQGITRKSRYRVQILPPQGFQVPRGFTDRIESISFPGQNIRSVPDSLRYGPEREQAQGMTYGPISATFITGRSQIEKTFFGRWQSLTVNKATWEPRYYEQYTGGLRIWHLGERNNDQDGIEIFEAFPKLIQAQDVGYAQSNTYQTLSVEFTFHHWYGIAGRGGGGGIIGKGKSVKNSKKGKDTWTKQHGFYAKNYKGAQQQQREGAPEAEAEVEPAVDSSGGGGWT